MRPTTPISARNTPPWSARQPESAAQRSSLHLVLREGVVPRGVDGVAGLVQRHRVDVELGVLLLDHLVRLQVHEDQEAVARAASRQPPSGANTRRFTRPLCFVLSNRRDFFSSCQSNTSTRAGPSRWSTLP